MKDKQLNVIISNLKKKIFRNSYLIDENNKLHPFLDFKLDSNTFELRINFVNTVQQQSVSTETSTTENYTSEEQPDKSETSYET
mgnify:CR=1 FL=1